MKPKQLEEFPKVNIIEQFLINFEYLRAHMDDLNLQNKILTRMNILVGLQKLDEEEKASYEEFKNSEKNLQNAQKFLDYIIGRLKDKTPE